MNNEKFITVLTALSEKIENLELEVRVKTYQIESLTEENEKLKKELKNE